MSILFCKLVEAELEINLINRTPQHQKCHILIAHMDTLV